MLILKDGILYGNGAPVRGDIAIQDGRLLCVGGTIPCGDSDTVVDMKGRYVTAGLIDAHTHAGLMISGSRDSDHNERSNPITPQLRAIDAINPFDRVFTDARNAGITTLVCCPGSINLIGGTCAALKTAGTVVDDMVVKNPVAMKAAMGENPKFRYTEQGMSPRSRMASANLIRNALVKTQEYRNRIAEGSSVSRDLGLEALVPVLEGRLPLKVHCMRSDDIATVIRISREFNIRFTLDHCYEGYMIPDVIRAAIESGLCMGVITGPLISYRRKLECANSIYLELPKRLYDAGIPFAICTDFYEVPQELLRECAILAAREGLPDEVAFAAVTSKAADIAGLSDHTGRLQEGLDADIAVFNGDPMDIKSRCVMTLVNGKKVYERRI